MIIIACYTVLLFGIALIMYSASRVKDPGASIIGLRLPHLVNNPVLWQHRHRTAAAIFFVDGFAYCISGILVQLFYTGESVPARVLQTALFVLYVVFPLYWLTLPAKRPS